MNKYLGICILVLLTDLSQGLSSLSQKDRKSLRMVLALFRHGVRSPIGTFPKDPHANYPWVGGYGVLQPKGVEQLYELGLNMRLRYKFFIPNGTLQAKRKIYAVTSHSARCIGSAQSFLKGFLRHSKGFRRTSLQPVALHIISPDQDTYFMLNKTCPKADVIKQFLREDPKSTLAPYLQNATILRHYASSIIGAPITSLWNLAILCDALQAYHLFGLSLPDWSSKIYPSKCEPFLVNFFLSYTATPELKRFRGGTLLGEFLQKMKAVREMKTWRGRNIFIYSGHDLTQISLFNSMNLKSQLRKQSSCGSAVVFELHENTKLGNDLEVRMIRYREPNETIPRRLHIPRCPVPCSLTKFEKSVKHLLLDDFDDECNEWFE